LGFNVAGIEVRRLLECNQQMIADNFSYEACRLRPIEHYATVLRVQSATHGHDLSADSSRGKKSEH
jgi:hypothetical protein